MLDRFAADGVNDVLFSGGEVLLRKDTLEIVDYARARLPSARLRLFTNASRLTEDLILVFKERQVKLATSLQGSGRSRLRETLGGVDAGASRGMSVSWGRDIEGGELRRRTRNQKGIFGRGVYKKGCSEGEFVVEESGSSGAMEPKDATEYANLLVDFRAVDHHILV